MRMDYGTQVTIKAFRPLVGRTHFWYRYISGFVNLYDPFYAEQILKKLSETLIGIFSLGRNSLRLCTMLLFYPISAINWSSLWLETWIHVRIAHQNVYNLNSNFLTVNILSRHILRKW